VGGGNTNTSTWHHQSWRVLGRPSAARCSGCARETGYSCLIRIRIQDAMPRTGESQYVDYRTAVPRYPSQKSSRSIRALEKSILCIKRECSASFARRSRLRKPLPCCAEEFDRAHPHSVAPCPCPRNAMLTANRPRSVAGTIGYLGSFFATSAGTSVQLYRVLRQA